MADLSSIDSFDDQISALETSLGGAQAMTAAFNAELKVMRVTVADLGTDVNRLSRGFSRGLRRAFDSVILDGGKLSDALSGLAQSMADTVYSAAIQPVANHFGGLLAGALGGLFTGSPFADGAAFSQGRVVPFARGGIVTGPTLFPIAAGTGLMGEAGAEAILPLSRTADGRLGVQSQGGSTRPINVTVNITTPDVENFRRSQSQIAAQMGRALARGQRLR